MKALARGDPTLLNFEVIASSVTATCLDPFPPLMLCRRISPQ
jgi:hypothetical protein